MTTIRLRLALAAATGIGLATTPSLAQSTAPVGVVVNGTLIQLDQPPVEQAGRIFVPLRGIFERLGASVVFQNGQINATAGSTTIALHVGQSTAYVNGQPQPLETPPFLVAGRALVPLRFVAQALGARVSFEQSGPYGRAVIVAETPSAPVVAPPVDRQPAERPVDRPPVERPYPSQPAVPPTSHQNLIREEPAIDATIAAIRPEISSTFALPTDPDTVKIAIDGRDVTADAYVNDRNFLLHPLFDLPPGRHTVRVVGATASPRGRFDEQWAFAVEAPHGDNYLRDLEPANGTKVGTSFDVRGFTVPGAKVHVVATASTRAIGFDETNSDQTAADADANEDGYFRIHIDVADQGSGVVDVRIASTTPDGAVSAQTLRLRP